MRQLISYSLKITTLLTLLAPSTFAGPQGTTLTGTKTAASTWNEVNTYSWTITETTQFPNQLPYVIPEGQTATAGFTITATRNGPTVTQSNTPITGQICLQNTGLRATQGLYLTDRLEQEVSPGVWNVVAGPITIPTGGELAAGQSQCYNYNLNYPLNPNNTYRNHAVATIDNYLGYEGMAHSIDILAAVDITVNHTDVDATATIVNPFDCPAGFTCTLSGSSYFVTGTTTIPVSAALTNNTATCGQTLIATNHSILTPSTNPVPISASASISIYTGTCH